MVGFVDLLAGVCLLPAVYGASSTPSPSTTTSSVHHQFSLPASADNGANLIANIDDPKAVDAQSTCPGYKASNVQNSTSGVTATLQLSGQACNAYGTDIESLDLTVEYLAKDRLNILITPSHVDDSNASWYHLDEHVVPRPLADENGALGDDSDVEFTWSNDPSFGFMVTRKSTGDVLFDTVGSVLVYQNQFIEFVTALPDNYNLYGLGEHIQQLRLLPNATMTVYNADAADPIDR